MSDEAELLECLCGRGWDAAVEVDLDRAAALLARDPTLSGRSVFTAAAVGDVVALREHLRADSQAALRAGGPRHWEPILYNAFSFAHRLPGRERGLLESLAVLLEAGADPATAYSVPEQDNPFSALYGTIAVTEHRPRTRALLAAGAPPSDGNSTYHAVETFDLDLLRDLCEHGIELDDASYTIKHAIDMQWDDAVRLLLDHGAEPDAAHPAENETTLHWAIKRCASRRVIEWLLEAGADVARPTRDGRTSYDYALRYGHGEALELFGGAGLSASDTSVEARFVHAIAAGDGATARALLRDDSELFGRLPAEDRALLATWAQHGRSDAVRLASELGFDVDSTAWMGLNALHWAALRGDRELVRILIEAGATPVDLGGFFGTPLHTARNHRWYDGDYAGVIELLETIG